jgi:hypothetical protein
MSGTLELALFMAKAILIVLIPTILLFHLVSQYFFCPRFSFSTPRPFTGDSIYNPFQNFHREEWKKSNFHSHCKAWNGITNGHGTNDKIWDVYEQLDYSYHAVSNYQFIDTFNRGKPNYISAYEHGFNIKKTHQLVLGDHGVVWKDFIFPENLANKQYILSELAVDHDNVVIINHPEVRQGYSTDDMKYLQNYDAIEVLNPAAASFAHADTALSYGKYFALIGNDDLHNISEKTSAGRFGTLVYSPTASRKTLINSIKSLKTIAYKVPDREQFDEKVSLLRNADISLESLEVNGDTINISFREKVYDFSCTGQNGKTDFAKDSLSGIAIPFPKTQSYMRMSFTTKDGIRYFLSPLFRYAGGKLESREYRAGVLVQRFPGRNLEGLLVLIAWSCLIVTTFSRRKRGETVRPKPRRNKGFVLMPE